MSQISNASNEYNFSFKILHDNKLYDYKHLNESELFKVLNDKTTKIIPTLGITDSEGSELTLGDILLYRNDDFKSYYYIDYNHFDGFILIPFNNYDTIWDNVDVLINENKNFTILGNKFSNKELYNKLINKYND